MWIPSFSSISSIMSHLSIFSKYSNSNPIELSFHILKTSSVGDCLFIIAGIAWGQIPAKVTRPCQSLKINQILLNGVFFFLIYWL